MAVSCRDYFTGVYLISIAVYFCDVTEIKLLWQDLKFEGESNIVSHLKCVWINDYELTDIACSDPFLSEKPISVSFLI